MDGCRALPSSLGDGELARRIAGAGGALAEPEEAELCRRYARRVYLYGRRHLRRDDLALDLAQEVLVLTLEKLRAGEVREPERIGSFILGAARMLSRANRRDGARSRPLEDAGGAELAVEVAVPDPLARVQVARCLEALEDRQRAVIVLTYYGEQATDEIAASLGLTANNVRVIRHRGIARLRGCLGVGQGEAAA